jgi:hypothetical protein
VRIRLLAIATASLALFATPSAAQTTDEPLLDLLAQNFRTRALRLGAYFQVLGDYQEERTLAEGQNGFTIPRARISLRGELDRKLAYTIEADLARSPALNDAVLRANLSSGFGVDMGQFKPPFSGERLQSTSTLEFINRSQIVTALAPSRNIGVQMRGALGTTGLRYAAGMFNGNGQRSLTNDNEEFMYAGRVTLRVNPFDSSAPSSGIEIGVNGLTSRDAAVSLGYGLGSTFSGERTMFGADLRAEHGVVIVTAEYIGARLDNAVEDLVSKPHGYQASLTLKLSAANRVHGRWDSIQSDGLRTDRDLGILGWSHQISTPAKFMFNYVFPSAEGAKRHRVLTQMQLVF